MTGMESPSPKGRKPSNLNFKTSDALSFFLCASSSLLLLTSKHEGEEVLVARALLPLPPSPLRSSVARGCLWLL